MNKALKILLLSSILCGCSFNLNTTSSVTSSKESSIDNSDNVISVSSKDSSVISNSSSLSSSSISSQINDSIATPTSDPYIGVSYSEFYSNYKEATSYEDAMYRTEHGFLSGSIDNLNSIPLSNTVYSDGIHVKFNNHSYGYNEDNEIISYNINTIDGTYKTIYYNAAYIALEEVAAYIYAFGEVPPNSNYTSKSSGKQQSIAEWGEYGRVNIGDYSNDVNRYPNEPELPKYDSKNKAYQYIETDIGLKSYNNGSKITRGTLRIVFTGEYKDGSKVEDVNERYVFYTYNHYEDFQEYLNYYGGWSDRFGYETGNSISPTPYEKALIVDKNTLN